MEETERRTPKKASKISPEQLTERQKVALKNLTLYLVCEWKDCKDVFGNMEEFVPHVEGHLYLTSEADIALDDILKSDKGCKCLWSECAFLASSVDELRRHVLFHAYHVKLKCVGSSLLKLTNTQECALDVQGRNLIPDLPDKFYCSWSSCQESFDDPYEFYNHINQHIEHFPKSNVRGGVTCEWVDCGNSFQNQRRLRDHLRSHSQEKLAACPTCGGLFSNKTKFLDHVRRQVAANNQAYQCSHCNKRFSSERLLRDHMRVHVNHYKCPYCDMTCPTPSNLNCHVKYRHTKEKPFACDSCDNSFKTPNDLRRHMETHNEDIGYECTQPGCSFITRSSKSFMGHVKKYHTKNGNSKYMCHICGATMSRGTYLTAHLMKKHKFRRPSGHSRFRYKHDEDGFYRLQTVRYESIELTQQMMDTQDDDEEDEDEEYEDGNEGGSMCEVQEITAAAAAAEETPPESCIELPVVLEEIEDGTVVFSIQGENANVIVETL